MPAGSNKECGRGRARRTNGPDVPSEADLALARGGKVQRADDGADDGRSGEGNAELDKADLDGNAKVDVGAEAFVQQAHGRQ